MAVIGGGVSGINVEKFVSESGFEPNIMKEESLEGIKVLQINYEFFHHKKAELEILKKSNIKRSAIQRT